MTDVVRKRKRGPHCSCISRIRIQGGDESTPEGRTPLSGRVPYPRKSVATCSPPETPVASGSPPGARVRARVLKTVFASATPCPTPASTRFPTWVKTRDTDPPKRRRIKQTKGMRKDHLNVRRRRILAGDLGNDG